MPRPIASVHVDLARLSYEYSKVSLESAESAESLMRARAAWIDDLVSSLLLRDPSLSAYGAYLLSEVEEYRHAESERKKERIRGKSNPRNPKLSEDSTESAESQLRADRADRADRSGKKTDPVQGGRSSLGSAGKRDGAGGAA